MSSPSDLPVPDNEAERLNALHGYRILDTLPEQAYDDIVFLAAFICETPIALISLIDDKRQWFKSKVGLDIDQTSRDISFCTHAIVDQDEILVVNDARNDPRFANNELVSASPFIRFYAGAPLVDAGKHALGTLCVIDRVPRVLTPWQRKGLEALSRQVMELLDSRARAAALYTSEQRFRAFFERSMVGMATLNLDLQWLDVNEALCVLLGYGGDALRGQPWSTLRLVDDADGDRALFAQLTAGHADDVEHETRLRRRDGRIVDVRLAVRCVRRADGAADYFVVAAQDLTQHRQSAEVIWKQTNLDALTELPNRHMFRNRLDDAMRKTARDGNGLALLSIDIDDFKAANDSLGHPQGDRLLVETAHRLGACLRKTDLLARAGSDEFLVLLASRGLPANVDAVVQKIFACLDDPFVLDNETVYLSASIGVTLHTDDAVDAEQMMRNAGHAMYAAKQRGRKCIHYYTPALQDAAHQRLRMGSDLRNAVKRGEFRVLFQPIIDLRNHRVAKVEALVRWQHPVNGLISPADFIPLAEEIGVIPQIGEMVFTEALEWSRRWQRHQAGGVQVSVNMSPLQFGLDTPHVERLIDRLAADTEAAAGMVVEITEGLLMHAEPHVLDKIARFRKNGVQIAIDDFGTGYSSLSYLRKFEIDFLKIDQSFVCNLENQGNDQALCEAIIVMAHRLGLKVIAEGVETEGQRAILHAAGCDFGQGYLFSRPIPPEQVAAFIERQGG